MKTLKAIVAKNKMHLLKNLSTNASNEIDRKSKSSAWLCDAKRTSLETGKTPGTHAS